MEKSTDSPRESQHALGQIEKLLEEASNSRIEKSIADLDVNLVIITILDHINIQYVIVHEFAFSLTVGSRKWSSNRFAMFASLNLPGNCA
jgi:hypothetical protein